MFMHVLLQLINGLTIQKEYAIIGTVSIHFFFVYTVLALGSSCLSDATNASSPHKEKVRHGCAFVFIWVLK